MKVLGSGKFRIVCSFKNIPEWVPFLATVLKLTFKQETDGQLYVLPFAKSAFAEQQTPVRTISRLCLDSCLTSSQDNTAYAFLQLDDRLLIYRGSDQPDMSVINPESDVWQQVKVRTIYIDGLLLNMFYYEDPP